jgi:hypothetical protein
MYQLKGDVMFGDVVRLVLIGQNLPLPGFLHGGHGCEEISSLDRHHVRRKKVFFSLSELLVQSSATTDCCRDNR